MLRDMRARWNVQAQGEISADGSLPRPPVNTRCKEHREGQGEHLGGICRDRTSLPRSTYRKDIIAVVSRHRLPAIYGNPEFTDDGGLMVYGPSFFEMSRRLASFVDRILKGAKPADLPFEQAAQFDLKVNLKTARELGLTVPALVLQQAAEVIE